ncbi:MAG: hypothetical protein JWP81_3300 [Ferruginibacter sp.]|nr:hypothetical protein [Ferruginibacter sp.]
MLDNLMNLIRQNSGNAILNNNAIPNERNEQAVQTAGTSIISTLQNALAGGRISEVLNFFKGGGATSQDIVKEATDNYANDLQRNVGLDETAAQDAASRVVPATMDQLASKTADPSDSSFNIQDIFNKLSGGKTGRMDVQALLNKFGGGKFDKDRDGDVDLQDLKTMFSGGGGIMDKVKGMFD